MKGKTIHEMTIGESASWSKQIGDADVQAFAQVSGDFNPVHVDEEFAKTTIFKNRIAHGMLCGSLFSTILGTKLPGEGSIYISQDLSFRKPVFLNDTITATCTVKELQVERNRVIMETVAHNQNGELVISGTAMLMPAK